MSELTKIEDLKQRHKASFHHGHATAYAVGAEAVAYAESLVRELLALRTLLDAGDEEVVRLAEEYQLGETEFHRIETYKKLEGLAITRGQQLREAQAEIEKRKGDFENDGNVITRLSKEKMRLIQLFRWWVREYSRFSPEEIILRGDEPRVDDVREIMECLEE